MGAYQELSDTGRPGEHTCALLRRLGRQVTTASSFPPPEGHHEWTGDAIDDLLGSMFEKRGNALVLGCLTKATDDGSLERLLLKAIRNFLIDEAKGTERGKLRRRLETLLGQDSRFARLEGHAWRLVNHPPHAVWQGDITTLHQVASGVRGVVLAKLPPSGPTPKASVRALVTVVHAVLVAADGAVRDEDLAHVLEARFALLNTPVTVALVADDGFEPSAPTEHEPESIVMESQERAEELWQTLAPLERSLLPHLTKPVEDVMAVAEVGQETAKSLRAALLEKVKRATADDTERESTLRMLLHLCESRP